jgi:hypothetical protein
LVAALFTGASTNNLDKITYNSSGPRMGRVFSFSFFVFMGPFRNEDLKAERGFER